MVHEKDLETIEVRITFDTDKADAEGILGFLEDTEAVIRAELLFT